jgi:hypothetical protein
MESLWREDESESDLEEEENNVPPAGVDAEFCRCIQTLKMNLYETIVLGPELNTPDAQKNELIQTYVKQLGRLYDVMENALKGRVVDAEMRPFPIRLRHSILTCSQWVHRLVKGKTPTDLVPYRDYLNTTLRVYPFVHHIRIIGGEDDIETM